MAKKHNSDDLFADDAPPAASQDFASLFEQSLDSTKKRLHVGDQLRAEILSIGKEEAFVSTGTPVDAVILTNDLLGNSAPDEQSAVTKELKYKVGDIIDIVILRVSHDEIRATRKGSKSAPVTMENLEDAYDMELPVEGKVTEVVNGGYRVSVQGQSAFCPISQLDSKPISDPASMIGKKFEFMITQFDARKRNLVVSRRKLLDSQKVEKEGLWIQENKVGDIVSGVITRTENYGAFVEVAEGVEGLVHVSEIGFVRLKHATEAVHVGDNVQVKILKIEEGDRLKISLSIKQAGGVGDPWLEIPQKYPVGTLFEGVVDAKAEFGLFINVIPGINGLLPKSKWRDADEPKIYDHAKRGDRVKVRVDEIRFEDRKIALGLPTEAEDLSWKDHQSGSSPGMGTLAAAFSKANTKK
jgi:small subunit ribosomal protein S1